jgi:predicted solute-binding protein
MSFEHLKRKRFTTSLPPVPVSSEMKLDIDSFAKERGVSMSEIVRLAVEVFLSANYSKTTVLPYKKEVVS